MFLCLNTFTYCGIAFRSRVISCGCKPISYIPCLAARILKTYEKGDLKKMKNEKEKLEKDLENAQMKLSQTEHKVQALENQRKFLMKKEDRQRTHHLCNMGGAIQSISKDADALTKVEFFLLMEQIFSLSAVQELVAEAKRKHDEGGDV
ncbi:DUF3847 domain-containing protein [[Ruminococcus] lactaris]|uniref:DUF3847 domain-containing protein n=2 Tax=[Ruminococcus] lactaris TaxID=46228 RepID=A0A3E4LPD6_9FIRM|nr:DUF3847 domain-containing protein [[Ruminococcus] lactaris]RHJ57508.1 DUF3847 domain-containing protein [[Ruminococcus] lactaris]